MKIQKLLLTSTLILTLSNSIQQTTEPIYTPWLTVVGNPTHKIPLKNININTKIVENLARVEIEQEYLNDSELNLETTFKFPISSDAVFDSFKAVVGEKIIIGQIKEL